MYNTWLAGLGPTLCCRVMCLEVNASTFVYLLLVPGMEVFPKMLPGPLGEIERIIQLRHTQRRPTGFWRFIKWCSNVQPPTPEPSLYYIPGFVPCCCSVLGVGSIPRWVSSRGWSITILSMVTLIDPYSWPTGKYSCLWCSVEQAGLAYWPCQQELICLSSSCYLRFEVGYVAG